MRAEDGLPHNVLAVRNAPFQAREPLWFPGTKYSPHQTPQQHRTAPLSFPQAPQSAPAPSTAHGFPARAAHSGYAAGVPPPPVHENVLASQPHRNPAAELRGRS